MKKKGCIERQDIQEGTPIVYPRPSAKRIKDLIQKEAGKTILLLSYKHDDPKVE